MIMESDGLLHALLLDGNGGGRDLTWDEINRWNPDEGTLWIHFNYTSENTADWLQEKSGLEALIVEALISEETRPRSTIIGKGVFMSLRGINFNPGESYEDMVSVRIWAEEHRIITTRKRQLLSVTDIAKQLRQNCGPETTSQLIIEISDLLTSYIEEAVERIEDKTIELEEQVMSSHDSTLRTRISSIRRDAIIIRRYLAPQREAITRMHVDSVAWITEKDKRHLHEIANILIRTVEDLDSIRDRASVAREELTNALSAQLNSRMYVLSIITAIFLPLSFFTGLFGVNIGGIPGATFKWAFSIFILFLIGVCVCQYIYFRKKGWI
ncbi:zinc transporter ZntB [Desulforhopalus sp. IMCC35007]|nr:zinc transporter ZntB [Desulforhopalus sp. IMCC35007]